MTWALGVMLHELCSSGERITPTNRKPFRVSAEIPYWAHILCGHLLAFNDFDRPSIKSINIELPENIIDFSEEWLNGDRSRIPLSSPSL